MLYPNQKQLPESYIYAYHDVKHLYLIGYVVISKPTADTILRDVVKEGETAF